MVGGGGVAGVRFAHLNGAAVGQLLSCFLSFRSDASRPPRRLARWRRRHRSPVVARTRPPPKWRNGTGCNRALPPPLRAPPACRAGRACGSNTPPLPGDTRPRAAHLPAPAPLGGHPRAAVRRGVGAPPCAWTAAEWGGGRGWRIARGRGGRRATGDCHHLTTVSVAQRPGRGGWAALAVRYRYSAGLCTHGCAAAPATAAAAPAHVLRGWLADQPICQGGGGGGGESESSLWRVTSPVRASPRPPAGSDATPLEGGGTSPSHPSQRAGVAPRACAQKKRSNGALRARFVPHRWNVCLKNPTRRQAVCAPPRRPHGLGSCPDPPPVGLSIQTQIAGGHIPVCFLSRSSSRPPPPSHPAPPARTCEKVGCHRTQGGWP